jgi:hypothetical protein
MKVIKIPEKGSRAILKSGDTTKDFAFIEGEGNVDYICGNSTCGNVICRNVFEGQIKDIVFLCPRCNKYNEIV